MTDSSQEATGHDMRRDFDNRDDLIAYLREQFPAATAIDDHVSETKGGRQAAEAQMEQANPGKAYKNTRNYLDGAVSRMAPYIRYGVMPLAEVRDMALASVGSDYDAEKFVNELGWRDYWQRLYAQLGDGIWEDRENWKTGYQSGDYADALPDDIRNGTTGMVCVDEMSRELRETGYLHNHQRMWLAAYIVHWRHVKWQAGARWFLEHLLDGDPASNNMSWQWVASTFSHKPYFFNRENVEKFSNGVYCKQCPLYGNCDFEGSYAEIETRLFPDKPTDNGRSKGKNRKGGRR